MNKKQLKDKYKEEKVFVIPFEGTKELKDGFTPQNHSKEIWSKFDKKGEYIFRYDAEGNPEFQQIIPYIVVLDEKEEKIFTTTRVGGEQRLIDKISIGVGGHINEEDGFNEIIFKCAVRELFEELDINYVSPFTFIGYVRDMTSNTNDHLGVVLTIRSKYNVKIKEKNNLVGEWKTIDELVLNYNKLENWSKYIVDFFIENNILN